MARFSLSNALSGTMSGAGTGLAASGGNPWIIGGGAALGFLSGALGEEETENDKLSRMLMGENLKAMKMNNAEAARDAAAKRKLDGRQKKIGAGLGNLMRGANLARRMMG